MISAVVLTKNEEKNIKNCLESLKFCGEIIVVDDNSEDNTTEIAKKLGAKIHTRALDNDFSAQRNFGLTQAKGDWALFIDADERVSPALASEIIDRTWAVPGRFEKDYPRGFYIKRQDVMWGKELKHGETGNIELLRLARRDAGGWLGKVHETWSVQGVKATLKNPIAHFPHQTLREFIAEVDFYSTLHAKEKQSRGVKSSIIKILLFPKLKFFQNWILRRGFLDGVPGLLSALIMSFHSFLAWSKLYLLAKKK